MISSEEPELEAPRPLFSPSSAGSTVQRLVLGGHLRRLREEAGITTEHAGAVIRGSHSKISRMEHGRVGFRERDIADLLTLYGVGDGDERDALLKLARESNLPVWWQSYLDILPHWVEPYLGLEAAASFIKEYELQLVPGLLQTEAYARAVMQLGNASEEEVVRRAEAVVSRQEILKRENPPRLWVVLDEGALRRNIGGRDVMQAQLRHLIEMSDHPAVTLQILPFAAGAHRGMNVPFTILRFTEPDLRDVVFIEHLTGALYLDKEAEVTSYLDVIDEVCLLAEPSAKTKAFIEQVAREMQAVPSAGQTSADFAHTLRDVPSLAASRDRKQPSADAETSGALWPARAPGADTDAPSAASGLLTLRKRLAAAAAPARIGGPLDEEALADLRQVVDNSDTPTLLEARYTLGWLYWYQYLALPEGQDSSALESCVALFTPCFVAGQAEFPEPLLSVLAERAVPAAVKLLEQALNSSDLNLLAESVSLWERIVGATSSDDAHAAMWSSNLGVALRVRFERTGEMTDLESAIAVGRAAVAALPASHPDQVAAMSNLGGALLDSYLSTGSVADLNAAVDLTGTAADSVQVGNPDRAKYLSNLGRALGVRFERTGDLADLESGIAAGRAAVIALPANHPDRGLAAFNLEKALDARNGRTGS